VDPIGQCNVSEEEEEQEENQEPVTVVEDSDATSVEAQLEAIKNAVSNIQKIYASAHLNRVNIRRASAFKDYSIVRRKKWFKPKGMLKIIFLGEPAIDDGGPKREFFSGKKT
jgi:hypothetical protein